MQTFDLIIVGGGLVGSLLAASLLREPKTQQLKIALVEASHTPQFFKGEDFDPRVLALSKRSQQLLIQLGLWEDMAQQRVCPYFRMEVWDGEGTGHIEFDCHDIHASELGHIVEHSVILHALQQRLANSDRLHFFQGEKVEDMARCSAQKHTEISLQSGLKIAAPLVVAADGALSRIRSKAGFATREWDYEQTAIVTTVTTTKSHHFCARQRFTSHGPLAFLPLSSDGHDSHHASIVWSLDRAVAASILDLDDGAFCQQLERAFESRLGPVLATAKRHAIALHQRHSIEYCKPGVVLVGDAAHAIHPLAGQGVNLGFYDVEVLAAELTRACERDLPLSETSILQRYQRQRQAHNLAAMLSMEGFKRLFGSDNLLLHGLRNYGMTWLNQRPFVKRHFAKLASGY